MNTNQNDYLDPKAEQVTRALTEAIMESVVAASQALEKAEVKASPSEIAHDVIANMLIFLMEANKRKSVSVTIQDEGDGYETHFHYDFTDADPEHLTVAVGKKVTPTSTEN